MELFIIIGALIAFGIFVLIRFLKNCDKAQDGAQYQELRDLVAAALPGESGLQVAYGFLENVEYRGKVTLTTYYWYALTFRSDCLWIAPLGFEKKTNEMGLTAPMVLVRPEELGMVKVNASKKRKFFFWSSIVRSAASRLTVTLRPPIEEATAFIGRISISRRLARRSVGRWNDGRSG